MKSKSRFLSSCLLAATLACSIAGTACAEHHSYRVYDPYYSDYHVWNNDEVVYYHQWAGEDHRHDHDRTTTATTTKIAIDTGLIGNRQRRRLPPFPAMDGLQRPSWGIDIWSELWQK